MTRNNTYRRLAVGMVALACAGFADYTQAATISITTSDDADTNYTVNDPDVGSYSVTISGQSGKTLQPDGNQYFRTGSTSSAVSQNWSIAVSGLAPNEVITDFTMNTTRIVPNVGGGSDWNWDIDLSAPLAGGGSFTDHRDLVGPTSNVSPVLAFIAPAGDSFGANPTFSILVAKSNSSNRTLGWFDFSITAQVVPEPPTALILLVGLAFGAIVYFARRNLSTS